MLKRFLALGLLGVAASENNMEVTDLTVGDALTVQGPLTADGDMYVGSTDSTLQVNGGIVGYDGGPVRFPNGIGGDIASSGGGDELNPSTSGGDELAGRRLYGDDPENLQVKSGLNVHGTVYGAVDEHGLPSPLRVDQQIVDSNLEVSGTIYGADESDNGAEESDNNLRVLRVLGKIGGSSGDPLKVEGGLDVGGSLDVGGGLNLGSEATMTVYNIQTGPGGDSVTVKDTLTVTGKLHAQHDLTVQDDLTVQGILTTDGDMTVGSTDSTLQVNGGIVGYDGGPVRFPNGIGGDIASSGGGDELNPSTGGGDELSRRRLYGGNPENLQVKSGLNVHGTVYGAVDEHGFPSPLRVDQQIVDSNLEVSGTIYGAEDSGNIDLRVLRVLGKIGGSSGAPLQVEAGLSFGDHVLTQDIVEFLVGLYNAGGMTDDAKRQCFKAQYAALQGCGSTSG